MAVFDISACAALVERLTVIATHAAATIRHCGPGLLRRRPTALPSPQRTRLRAVILLGLEELAPQIPVISEGRSAAAEVSALVGSTYFLVDPLDGTREFVSGRDEVTVNIALIDASVPILGIIIAHERRKMVAETKRQAEADRPTRASGNRMAKVQEKPPWED